MKTLLNSIFTIGLVSFLCFAISNTNDESWLTVWFLLFIFAGIPLTLLALRDLVAIVASKYLGPSQILLHICAVFGAIIGYVLGQMAVNTEHDEANLHQLLVIIFPIIVYTMPLLMIFNGLPLSRVKEFYFKSRQNGN